jgi:peroxiredoxin
MHLNEKKPFTLPLGSKAPNFSLKGTDGKLHSLQDFKDAKGVVVFFTCNHCPYVINSDELTRKTVEKFSNKGIVFIGINSNSANTYPEDSYENMIERQKQHNFPWLYLHDATQETALAYGALRTPHFYLFDEKRHLIYTGRAVDSPRDLTKMTVNDLENALNEFCEGKSISNPMTNPIGCNVKWEGKEKKWMPADACDLV